MCLKFLSFFLLTGKIRMGYYQRGIIKKIVNDENSCFLKVVYNIEVIKLPFACSEFSVHTQNQFQTGSFVRTKLGFAERAIFLLHVL